MKIKSVTLERFKRFHRLSIPDLPPAKLVVLTGPNGAGKSSFFDGLLHWKITTGGFRGIHDLDPYYSRDPKGGITFQHAVITWHGNPPSAQAEIRRALDVRSSYRNEPEFLLSSLSQVSPIADEAHLQKMIQQDASVSRHYTRLAAMLAEKASNPQLRSNNIGELQDELFKDFSNALKNLFPGELEFVDIGRPLEDGTFYFKKGAISRYPYMNLSGGEKAAFDLVLDLSLKKADMAAAVYCIDEPEAHMSTRLQGALLGELLRIVPDDAQLWIATHSIGMLRKARELYEADPSQVIFLDFSGKNFDQEVVLEPVIPTRSFWRSVLSVALDDLADLVVPGTIVVCEGNPRTPVPGKNAEHDARCYSVIFGESMPDVEFVSAGNASDVRTDRLAIMASIKKIARGVNIIPLIDRDDHAADDVEALRADGYRVLELRNLQNYLYSDEVLEALCDATGHPEQKEKVKEIKAAAIAASVAPPRSNPPDDVKKASGDIKNKLQPLLGLYGQGNDAYAIERNVLSPLIKPGMRVYDELRRAVFGTK